MTCQDVRERFSAFVDEVLAPEERAGLDAHLAECAECRKELGRLQSTLALLHRLERPRAPAGFVDRVLEAARPVRWYRRLFERFFLPLSVKLPAEAAALLLIAGLAAYLFQNNPELQRAARQEEFRTAPAPTTAPPSRQAASGGLAERRSTPNVENERKSLRMRDDLQRSLNKAPEPPAPEQGPRSRQVSPTEPGTEAGTERQKEKAAGGPGQQVPEGRADSPGERAMQAQAPMAAPPRAAMRASADVTGRLAVKDRGAAERALGKALARTGGVVVARREDAGTTVVEIALPKTAYPEFIRALADLGAWRPEEEPALLPPSVRLTLRLVD